MTNYPGLINSKNHKDRTIQDNILKDLEGLVPLPVIIKDKIKKYAIRISPLLLEELNSPLKDLAQYLGAEMLVDLVYACGGKAYSLPHPDKGGNIEKDRKGVLKALDKLFAIEDIALPDKPDLINALLDKLSDFTEITIPSRGGLKLKLQCVALNICDYHEVDIDIMQKISGRSTRSLKDRRKNIFTDEYKELIAQVMKSTNMDNDDHAGWRASQSFKSKEITSEICIAISSHIDKTVINKLTKTLRESAHNASLSIQLWTRETQKDIVNQAIDIGIHLDVGVRDTIVRTAILEEEMNAHMSKCHPAYKSSNDFINIEDLEGHPLAAVNMADHNEGITYIEKFAKDLGCKLKMMWRYPSMQSLISAAKEIESGAIFISGSGLEFSGMEAQVILLGGNVIKRDLCIYHIDKPCDDKKRLIDKITKVLQDHYAIANNR